MALAGEPKTAFSVVIAHARAYVAQKVALLVSGQGTSQQVIDDRFSGSTSNPGIHGWWRMGQFGYTNPLRDMVAHSEVSWAGFLQYP